MGASAMRDGQTVQAVPRLNARLLVGGIILMGLGGVVGLAGLALGGSALLSATRRWMRQMDMPPSELARQKLAQARAAATAGVGAWRDGQSVDQPQPS
jgi:hypothetical protein